MLQRKAELSSPDHPLEREADAVATAVTSDSLVSPSGRVQAPLVQRQCAACEEEDAPTILRARLAAQGSQLDPEHAQRVAERGGQPLSQQLRNYFEPRFGADLSQVRVHTDASAAAGASAVRAHAYTVGQHVVFGAGQYAPGTRAGRHLLAHELTHVLQQTSRGTPRLQRVEDETAAVPADSSQRKPETAPKVKPKDSPAAPAKGPPNGAARGPCGLPSLAASVVGSPTYADGKAYEASLSADTFGNTSKLAAFFEFSACKAGSDWRFGLKTLHVPLASKVQDPAFRREVSSAADAIVTRDSHSDIIEDLSPTRRGTFPISCGAKRVRDTVTTYSKRKVYWKRDLVVEHERFHRTSWMDTYRKELVTAESAVQAHAVPASAASSASDAIASARPQLEGFMIAAYTASCDAYAPTQESAAYDAGAPAYQKLVDDIKARATKEKW